MNYPRFSTLCGQAQREISRRVNDMQSVLTLLTDSNNMADAFFASGMSFRMHGNDNMPGALEIMNDTTGNKLLTYLQDDSIIKPSADKQKLIAIFKKNPSFSHRVFMEGYEYEKRLQHPEVKAAGPSTPVTSSAPAASWDANQWRKDFEASTTRDSTREERKKVWESTLAIVNAGRYVCQNGVMVKLQLNPNILAESKFYKDEIPALAAKTRYNTLYSVHAGDCLEFAKSLHDLDNSDDLCVLNLASYSNPGGGVINGAGAQEEYLFRCSDYFRSLFQYGMYCKQYGIPPASDSYPLDKDFGGVYSHGVTIFRDTEAKGYALLETPWHVNFVAAAVSHLPHPYQQIPASEIPMVENTIRTILRMAYTNGQRRLVLGALGCGAFNHPPKHMAQVFKKVLHEPEFNGIFKEVHFAIFDDHNAKRKGVSNVDAFTEVFKPSITLP